MRQPRIGQFRVFATLIYGAIYAAFQAPAAPAQIALAPHAVPFIPRGKALAQRVNIHARRLGLWTPQGARTELLGLWRGSFDNSKANESLVAHFYSVPTPRAVGGDSGKTKFGLFLDLWRVGKRGSRPMRLNHIALRTAWKALNGNWNRQSDRLFQLHLRRLDARGRILMLQATGGGNSISGVVGCEAVAVFPLGLKGRPRLQSFDTYMMAMGREQVFFDRRDKSGFLMARVVSGSVPNFQSNKTDSNTALWRWNGRAFIAAVGKR